MKAQLIPVYFKSAQDEDFRRQVQVLKGLLADEAEILEPRALGSRLPKGDAVVFPQLLGDAYRRVEDFRKIDVPILVVTSEFGTMAMWDWEIVAFMRTEGVETIAPYDLRQTKILCRSLAVKREMQSTKFLVIQDDPGEGFQADIFKRFYWWEDGCIERIRNKFGITIIKKSFKEFGARAKCIADDRAEAVRKKWDMKTEGIDAKMLNSALKVYIAAKDEAEGDPDIRGIGINCLNESHFSDTTPCLAWDMLFREKGILWGCEADTMSLLTEYLAHHCLGAPVMMTNIYPSLMGMAPLRHEHIDAFPDVADPDNCVLLAHCGYVGLIPASQATEWTLRPKVLAIVDDNATAVDARIPLGPTTMAKLDPTLNTMTVVDCVLEKYVQYPGSHCLNGGVVRVPSGPRLMARACSHHQCLLSGRWTTEMEFMGRVFGLNIEQM
jgi:hypothetical protein